MSRPNASAARPLSLTEELEKLEQSITLTLQEIDHNFSRAHRIVTSSILPIIEQYAEHSTAVWEGSKFWKQFFEASANVSLSGVEEREDEEEDPSYTQSHEDASAYTAQAGDDTMRSEANQRERYNQMDESLLGDDADISGSTPRARPTTANSDKAKFADYSSQYEALKQELKGKDQETGNDTQLAPTTPGRQAQIPDMSMTPQSSPFAPTSHARTATTSKQDPLLHRVLDKAYRIHATPHTAQKEKQTPGHTTTWRDAGSPMSSPVAAPQLRSEIFSSPVRQQYRPNAPRTPGLSVQTPAKAKGRKVSSQPAKKDEISWESDSDEDAEDVYQQLGMSPPKTIQFNLPQTRLLQTPAREASKRIVEDILATAGAGFDDTDELDSPSMVKMQDNLDDSF